MKWKVVDLVILTKNESLPDKKLLHPNQVGFLKGLLQQQFDQANVNSNSNSEVKSVGKIKKDSDSIFNAYRILHQFCLKLNLQLIHHRIVQLMKEGFMVEHSGEGFYL